MPKEQLKEFAKRYDGKVAKLLSLGEDKLVGKVKYSYIDNLGFTQDDVKQLLRLAQDMDIFQYDYDDMPEDEGIEFFGVIHAWYALSELEAPEAKEIFIDMLEDCRDDYYDDWILSDFRHLIKPFRKDMYELFEDRSQLEGYGVWTRLEYVGAIGDMLKAKEVENSRVDEYIVKVLSSCDNALVNASVVSICINEKLIQHHEVIKKCFERKAVDIDYIGDLEDVEIGLGLRKERETEPELTEMQKMFSGFKEMIDRKFGDGALENKLTFARDEPKIGRNDPCPCGSGKKYKKCCLSK